MGTRFDELAEQLAALNLQIKHDMEQAEAKVERVNLLVRELGLSGLIARRVLLGSVFERSYDCDPPQDASQVVQAALLVPEGFGVCIWDLEEYLAQRNTSEGLESKAHVFFHAFQNCSPVEKKFLLPCIEELLEDLSDIACIAASQLDTEPAIEAADYFSQRPGWNPTGTGE